MNINPWKTHERHPRYDNAWIQVSHHEVTTPGGNPGIYGVVHFKNWAIGIVPIDAAGYTWLVGQYRYTLDTYSWEIPEGGCPLGNDPLEAAQRELREETGITAQKWTHLLELHTSNSVTDEYGIAYVAQDLQMGMAQPEDTEDLTVRRLPVSEAIELAAKGEITDALSLAALFKLRMWLDSGLLKC